MANQIDILREKVRKLMADVEPGHDFGHIQRVEGNAVRIYQQEGGNLEVIRIAALLHDLVDYKLFDKQQSLAIINQWFDELSVAESVARHVFDIIQNLSFSAELDGAMPTSLEFVIVQDADRLEALGAIGIARTFSYGGSRQRPFFIEEALPVMPGSTSDYQAAVSPTINHFFEKLLTLHLRMKTTTGRQLALERHRFLIIFLNQFIDEWTFVDDASKVQWKRLIDKYAL